MQRITRLTLALALLLAPAAAASQVARAEPPAQDSGSLLDRPADLDVRGEGLIAALTRLESTSGVALVYSPSLLPRDAVTCVCRDSTVGGALEVLLASSGFVPRQVDGQVLVVPGRDGAERGRPGAGARQTTTVDMEQPATIVGQITSDGGSPLAGATVRVVGAGHSTFADGNGSYRIEVPEVDVAGTRDTLLVTMLGYRDRRVPFMLEPGTIRLDVSMTVDAIQLSEIVVTGTAGNRVRGAQPAVVSRIDAEEVVSRAPVSSVSQLLTGRVPGVNITGSSGTSGTASRINIRGAASLSLSNEPLVFIDGVRMDSRQRELVDVGGQSLSALDDLNVDEIDRIEVVKGPAAATLYGADASAGVIQIFTKQGEAGVEGVSQRLSVEFGLVEPNFSPRTNYARCPAALTDPSVGHPLCSGLDAGAVVSDNPLARQDAYGTGEVTSIQYSARGGGSDYGYYASIGAEDETGTTPNNGLERRTGRVNFNWITTPDLSFDASLGLSHNDVALPPGDQSSYGYMIGAGLGSPLTVSEGDAGSLAGGWLMPNESVESLAAISSDVTTLRVTPSIQVSYSPTSWWTNRLTVGGDISRSTAAQMFPKNTENWYTGDQAEGWVQTVRSNTDLYTVDYRGNVEVSFGEDDRFSSNLSFGSQYISRTNRVLQATGIGLTTNSSNLVSGAATNSAGEAYGQQKSLGLFLQEQLGYRDRLFLQLGARVDQNSAFGSDVGAFFLPKVGASYILSEEPFWEPLGSLVSTLRVRAAYGTTGRAPTPGAPLETYLSAPYITDAGSLEPGLIPLNPGNADLRAERGSELEAGLDAGFFDDRVGLELTYFSKRTTDLLIQVPQPPSSGFTQGSASRPFENVGEVLNRGFELTLDATPVAGSDVDWQMALQASTLHNELVSLGDLDPFVNSYRVFAPGRELGAWYVNRIREVDEENGQVVVSDTAEFLGGQMPDLEATLGTTLTLFGNLRLHGQLSGKFGYRVYNLGQEFRDRFYGNSAEAVLPPEEGGFTERERLRRYGPYVGESSGQAIPFTEVKEDYIQPGDHVRLSEVSASISLPEGLIEKVGLSSATFTLAGRNLALWSDFGGFDPEVLGTGPGTPGSTFYDQFYTAEVFTLPPARRWIGRFNVQF